MESGCCPLAQCHLRRGTKGADQDGVKLLAKRGWGALSIPLRFAAATRAPTSARISTRGSCNAGIGTSTRTGTIAVASFSIRVGISTGASECYGPCLAVHLHVRLHVRLTFASAITPAIFTDTLS